MSAPVSSRPAPGVAPAVAPHTARRHLREDTRLGRTVAFVAIGVTFAYLAWRLVATISLEWWWLSIPLFACDLYGAIGLVLYTIELWDVDSGQEPSGRIPDLRVAVLIPTYNEPPEVILPTIASSVALEPVHETWVLDDGKRPEVRELAEKLGARYLTRPDNRGAKAGNLNHALGVIDADVVAVLDADHVPTARFLTATLPYFNDERLAFVQTPQDFYNHDSFEHLRRGGQTYSEEDIFYQAIAPGKNRWGASFWCGTCALLRVSALRSVGGIATESVTEDVQTSIRLYRRGWKGVFRREVLARGLAPHDAYGFMLQRNRWAQGGMQVLRIEKPYRGLGLTRAQRVAFVTSLITWFSSWRTLAYLLIPIAVAFTGGTPVAAPADIFLPAFVMVLLLQLAAVRLLTGPTFSVATSMMFEIVRLPAVLPATLAFLRPRHRSTFKVTPKGRSGDARRRGTVPPILWILAVLSAVSLAWFAATTVGLTPYRYSMDWPPRMAAVFVGLSLVMILRSIARIRSAHFAGNRRASVRLPVRAPARLGSAACTVLDLSITGGRVLLTEAAEALLPERVDLSLLLPNQTIVFHCQVRRLYGKSTPAATGGAASARTAYEVGLAFDPGQEVQLAELSIALFHPAVLGDLAGRPRRSRRRARDVAPQPQDLTASSDQPAAA